MKTKVFSDTERQELYDVYDERFVDTMEIYFANRVPSAEWRNLARQYGKTFKVEYEQQNKKTNNYGTE